MADWNAGAYDRFAEARQRAARDLVLAVPELEAKLITDLGCGSGLSTQLLDERWPQAEITAVDRSPAMLERARERVPRARAVEGDIGNSDLWSNGSLQDLLFANASLHWLPAHDRLLPSLLARLRSGGVLALQMPVNLEEPSHRLMRETAGLPAYRESTRALTGNRPMLPAPDAYYDMLAASCSTLEIWVTRYLHPLSDVREIFELFATTGLKPYLDALPEDRRGAFIDDYVEALRGAYAQRSDGRVLLALPRLFIMATRH
ncbi:MAG: methyltransferase domain-containing protein [Pseudomonadota bacterium]